jgi:hypothetical protein
MLAVGVALPVVLTTLAVVAFSGLEMRGRTPFASELPHNIAEAAAMAAPAEVLRRLGFAEDPNRVWPVRRDIISSTVTRVTALEAAVWSRHREMLELLDRRGAIVGAETRRHLLCLAADVGVPEIVDYLSPGRAPDCARGQALAIVLERSKTLDP